MDLDRVPASDPKRISEQQFDPGQDPPGSPITGSDPEVEQLLSNTIRYHQI